MKWLYQAYSFFNILSLDVTLGACFLSYAICLTVGITPDIREIILLGNAIWTIYTLDHFYDGIKAGEKAYSKRRAFHAKYRRYLFVAIVLVIAVECFILFQLPHYFFYGLPALGVSLIYLLLNWYSQYSGRKFYTKEILIAAGYTAGILTIPYAVVGYSDKLVYAGVFTFFTAILNVWLIAWYEVETDRKEAQTSIAFWVSRKTLLVMVYIVLGLQFLSAWLFIPPWSLVMVSGMAMLSFFPRFFALHERYRILADGIFLIPGAFLVYYFMGLN